jgi:hypothetical protein
MESCFIVALFCSSFYLLDLCGQLYCLVLLPHQLAMRREDVCVSLWFVTFRLRGCSDESHNPSIPSPSCKLKPKGIRNLRRIFSFFLVGFQPPPVNQRSANLEPVNLAPIAGGSLHSSHPASQQHSTYVNGAGHSAASQPTVQNPTGNQNQDRPPIWQYLEKESARNESTKRPASEQGGRLQDGKRHRGEAPRVPGWKSKAGEAVDVSDQFALEDVNSKWTSTLFCYSIKAS